MKTISIPGTDRVIPVIGQGTWGMGVSPKQHAREVDALRQGIALGMTLIDTAELYAAGGAERVVGDAIADCRDQVFLITKVWPTHADRTSAFEAVRASLARMRTEYADAILLHWPTRSVPLNKTLGALQEMVQQGLLRFPGVSNFDVAWLAAAESQGQIFFDQVPYSLENRRVEHAVLPWCQSHGLILMAYSPLAHGRHVRWSTDPVVAAIASDHGVSTAQVALNWLVRRPGVIAIPKASDPRHVADNAQAGTWELNLDEAERIAARFPPEQRAFRPALPPYNAFYNLVYRAMQRRAAPQP